MPAPNFGSIPILVHKVGADGTTPAGGDSVSGPTAADAPLTANPVTTGGKAVSAAPAAVTANDVVNASYDLFGSARVLNVDAAGAAIDYTAVATVATQEKQTFGATVTALAPAAAATDIIAVGGSATKTIRIRRVQISGIATAAGAYDIVFAKRSTADTGGTGTAQTIVPYDSTNSAGTGTFTSYTANPTTGTLVGNFLSRKVTVSTAAGAIPIVVNEFDFGVDGQQSIVLRGTAEQLCVNLAGATMAGGLLNISIRWTEE